MASFRIPLVFVSLAAVGLGVLGFDEFPIFSASLVLVGVGGLFMIYDDWRNADG